MNLNWSENHKNHLLKYQNSKIQKLFNFGKVKYGKMGNFLRIPNIIFAKFYSCKKALKSLFFSLFLMEKDLSAKIPKNSGGYPKNPLFFSFPLFFFLPPVGRRARTALPRHVLPASGQDKAAAETSSPSSPSLTPSFLSSLPQNPGEAETSPPP